MWDVVGMKELWCYGGEENVMLAGRREAPRDDTK